MRFSESASTLNSSARCLQVPAVRCARWMTMHLGGREGMRGNGADTLEGAARNLGHQTALLSSLVAAIPRH
eukprot:1158375-Pelagomonas_calceolata.AAC.1